MRLCFAFALAGFVGSVGPDGVRDPYTAAQLAALVDLREVAVSPDGREIAFTSDRTGAYELWTVEIRGGTPCEPRQRTFAEEYVSGLVYSPDGELLVFEMAHGGDERTDLWVLRRGASEPERLTETPTAEQGVRFSPDGTRIALESDPDRSFRFNIHVMDLETGNVTQLTREPINVLVPRWSRDAATIVATRTGDDVAGELLVIDVETGEQRIIEPPQSDGILWPVEFLPSGHLLVTATNEIGFLQLATVDLASGEVAYFGPGDWDVEAVRATDDGAIVMSRNVHGTSEVSVVRPSDPEGRQVLLEDGVVRDLAVDRTGGMIAVLRESSNRPVELLLLDAAESVRTVVPADVAGVDIDRLSRAQLRTFESFDGTPVDAFVWRPPVARLGTPPPAVISVHGGPGEQVRGRFSPLIQALAEAGFLVIAPNYRGSTGYGRAFEDLNNHDWGGGDLQDLIAVVEELIEAGAIDRSRVGIMGGSYGGYLTLRAITARPDVWHAAVDMYGMPDLEEDYRIVADRFGSWYLTEMGDPVTNRELYRDRSPIHFLDRVTAALLVLQGENDTNVPREESDLVVEALRGRGHPVEYVVYPDEGHGFTRRENRIDSMSRTVEFFVRELSSRRQSP